LMDGKRESVSSTGSFLRTFSHRAKKMVTLLFFLAGRF
jgi:hypothetical protein